MSYSDSIQQIRNARAARDTGREQLYHLQLEYLQLKKQQRKAGDKDITQDPAITRQIEALQQQIAVLQSQLNDINKQLNNITQLHNRVKDLDDQLAQTRADILWAQNKIAGINNELQNAEISKKQRAALETEKAAVQQQLAALNKKLESLQHELEQVKAALANTPDQPSLEGRSREISAAIAGLQRQINGVLKEHPGFATGNTDTLEQKKKEIAKAIESGKGLSHSVGNAINGLFTQQTPQQLIAEWNDGLPILLTPVRLETKFKQLGDTNELWVRIFPDDIAVVTHEEVLTANEITYGIAHWKALWTAGSDNALKQTAWQLLTDKFGVNRAAWIALQTKPLNWENAGILVSESDLVFPEFDITKDNSWTVAPHTRIMPDRFVLLAYRSGQLAYSAVGRQIDDILVLGPAPVEDTDNPSLTRNETDNRINYSEDFSWLVNFEQAVDKGMGFKVPLNTADARAGFSQLLVIGLKLSADETDAKQLLQDLLENHRYSIEGMSLLQQGAPTNNTEEEDAAYSKKQTIADIAALVEKNQLLFEPTADLREATDGQRLADYLGLDYDLFQATPNSQLTDHKEAVAMNKALYAATLGYYMHSMLNKVTGDGAKQQLRAHFTNMVTGRGPLPAIRVGNQPYGIVVTSAFDKWKYPLRENRLSPATSFYQKMYDFLKYMQDAWQAKVPGLAHISKQGNANDNLMKVLGLHPNSVEFYQRVGYSWDYLQNIEKFGWGGQYFADTMKMAIESMYVRQLLQNFGYTATNADGTAKPIPLLLQLIFRHYQSRLDNKNLIDGEPLSETTGIKNYDEAGGLNYIDWLIANAADSSKLEQQDFGGAPKPNALLYLMLLYSQLHEAGESIYTYLATNNIAADELLVSRKFMNISSAPTVSHWEIFNAPVNKIVPAEASTLGMHSFVHEKLRLGGSSDFTSNLEEHLWGLNVLKDLPTARLERILVEHTDNLSYRLDAWQTSLFEERLQTQRNLRTDNKQRSTGIYLGAFGYLENVQPGNKRTNIPEDILPAALRENKNNLYVEAGNGGYVHAPSLNHATAAAILRNGYLTHATDADAQTLSVNLSSERVRRAKYLLEGIQNGQTLEALLGYQFERGLHDWTTRSVNPIIVSQLIPDFRQAFPLTKTKVPQEGNTTGPEETTNDYHVVNGLTLANTTTDFPYGISGLPPLSTDQINAVKTEKKEIEDTLDAMRDVLTAESAYQLALGNFERAAAVMQSISGATIPPGTEVINSSRGTDLSFTNKVALHFDPTVNTNPWPAVALTQKAIAEAAVNHWIGTILGDPAAVQCNVMAVDKDGTILKRLDNTEIKGFVSLQDLGLQPIDFMYLIRNKLEASGTSESEARIRYFFAQANALTDDTIVKIVFAESAAPDDLSIKSFAEILPLANYLRELLSGSAPLNARDYQPASKTVTAPANNPNNYNWNELLNRAQQVFTMFEGLYPQLNTAVADAGTINTPATTDALRTKLKQVADAGYVFAFPLSSFGTAQAQTDSLVAQAGSVLKRLDDARDAYNKTLVTVNKADTPIDQRISLLTDMIRLYLGADYIVLPRFSFNNLSDVNQAATHRDQLLNYALNDLAIALPVNEWLHGASLVRSKMHILEMVRLLNDGFNDTPLQGSPIQLPYRDNDTWLAVEFKEGTSILHDTLSIVQYNPQGFNPAAEQAGVLIDAWTEIIPNKEEVTGITFNYNQPNSVPPQALLLTVTPEQTGHWKWDNLVASILDTIDRAKRRAIEPDHVDVMNGISTLLPATLTEFTTAKNGISLDYSYIIKSVMQEVNTKFLQLPS